MSFESKRSSIETELLLQDVGVIPITLPDPAVPEATAATTPSAPVAAAAASAAAPVPTNPDGSDAGSSTPIGIDGQEPQESGVDSSDSSQVLSCGVSIFCSVFCHWLVVKCSNLGCCDVQADSSAAGEADDVHNAFASQEDTVGGLSSGLVIGIGAVAALLVLGLVASIIVFRRWKRTHGRSAAGNGAHVVRSCCIVFGDSFPVTPTSCIFLCCCCENSAQ